MAVETKFVVVRKGEEKMTFASKKEADAHDKLLDMAEAFTDWLLQFSWMKRRRTTFVCILPSRKSPCSISCVPASFPSSMLQRIKQRQRRIAAKKSGPSKPPDRQNDSSPVLLPRAGNGSRLNSAVNYHTTLATR